MFLYLLFEFSRDFFMQIYFLRWVEFLEVWSTSLLIHFA